MPEIPISQLPPAASVGTADYVPIDQNGTTKRATVQQIGAAAQALDQSFVTVGGESGTLPNSRIASATNGITKADSGPGGTLTFALTGQALNFFLLSTTGLTALTGGGSVVTRSLVGPGKGFTISNADGVAGNPTFSLTGGLLALEDLTGPGVVCSTGPDTYSPRTLTGTANQIDITNSQGAGGDPTFSIADDARLPGTGGFLPPGGTTAERPLSPPVGFTRRNTTLNVLETWDGAAWNSQISGGVTSISTGTGLTGGPITSTGTISIANTGVAAGTYGDAATVPIPTLNAQGQVTAMATAAITPASIGGVPASRTLTAGTGLTGGGDLSANRTFAVTVPLPDTAGQATNIPRVNAAGTAIEYRTPTQTRTDINALATDGDGSAVTVTATGSTTARTLAARAADVINVRDFGAAPANSAATNTTAVNAAISAAATDATLLFTGGDFSLTIGSLSFGGKNVTFRMDGATINGTFPLGVGALVEGQYQSGQRLYQGGGAATTDFALQYSYRNANYTGGTVTNTCSGILHVTDVGTGAANSEWGIVGVVNQYGGGQPTGVYGQGNRMSSTAGTVFGGVMEARDMSNAADPTVGLVGLEVDCFANGTDANGRRWGIDVVVGKGVDAGIKCEAQYGIHIGPVNGDSTLGRFKVAVDVTGDIDCGIDTSSASISAGGAAFRQAINQEFSFTSTNDRTLGYTSSGLDYKASGTTVARIRDDGAVHVVGVSSGNTAMRVPNGARISLTSFDDRTLRYSSSGFDYDVSGATKFRVTDAGAVQITSQVSVNGQIIADSAGLLGLRSYTVATLPSAGTAARLIYVSDGTSNKRLAVSDGTNWRWPDGLVVS